MSDPQTPDQHAELSLIEQLLEDRVHALIIETQDEDAVRRALAKMTERLPVLRAPAQPPLTEKKDRMIEILKTMVDHSRAALLAARRTISVGHPVQDHCEQVELEILLGLRVVAGLEGVTDSTQKGEP
jgi:ABC-type sugar transport system substrate-binding protein